MCLSVLQLFDDEVLNIYNTVKAKYEAMGPDKYKRFIHIEGVCQMASYLANEYHVNLRMLKLRPYFMIIINMKHQKK